MFDEVSIKRMQTMKIAYIISDDITWLDLIGVYDPIIWLK